MKCVLYLPPYGLAIILENYIIPDLSHNMGKPFVIVTTYPDKDSAERAAHDLVVERLAACCQVSQVASFYEWKGDVAEEAEYKLTIKSFAWLFEEIESFISKSHPYEIPEIIGTEIHSASRSYLEWMKSQVRNK